MVINFNVFPILFFLIPFFQPLSVVVVAVVSVVSRGSNSLCGYTVRLKWEKSLEVLPIYALSGLLDCTYFSACCFRCIAFFFFSDLPYTKNRIDLRIYHHVFEPKDTEKTKGRQQGGSTSTTGFGIDNSSKHGPSSSSSPHRWFCFPSLANQPVARLWIHSCVFASPADHDHCCRGRFAGTTSNKGLHISERLPVYCCSCILDSRHTISPVSLQ